MKFLIAIFGTVLILGGAYWLFKPKIQSDAKREATTAVKTINLEKRVLNEFLDVYGVVISDNSNTINISVPRNVIISKIFVQPGQVVKKGSALVELATDLDGNTTYAQALTARNLAKSEYTRIKKLVEEQLATTSQLETAEKALKDAESLLQTQQKIGNSAASQKLNAPFDGVISTITAAQGDHFARGSPIMQLSSSKFLTAELGIEPVDKEKIRPGLKVLLAPVFDKTKFTEGEISKVQAIINPTSQQLSAYASFPVESKFIQGTNVIAKIILATEENYAVPLNTVLNDDKGAYIYVVNNGVAKRIDITTGIEERDNIAINGKFEPNIKIITSGNYEVEDGSKITEEAK